MPALKPTPTTASLVQRQPIDIGGVAQDAGGAIGGAAQTGIAGAGGVAATAASGAGGAIETVANAPNAAISAGADAAGDQIADQVNKQASAYIAEAWANLKADFIANALTPILVVSAVATILGLGFWRRKYMKNRNRTFWLGRPIGGGDEDIGKDHRDDGKS